MEFTESATRWGMVPVSTSTGGFRGVNEVTRDRRYMFVCVHVISYCGEPGGEVLKTPKWKSYFSILSKRTPMITRKNPKIVSR